MKQSVDQQCRLLATFGVPSGLELHSARGQVFLVLGRSVSFVVMLLDVELTIVNRTMIISGSKPPVYLLLVQASSWLVEPSCTSTAAAHTE